MKTFYSALELQDGKLVFSYFTPPTTPEEKNGFNWLTGADLAEKPFYRAFLRIKISYPVVNDIQKVNDTTFIIAITDQLQTYSNAGEQVGWGSVQKRDVKLMVIKVGNDWLVDRFTHPSTNPGTEKYSGFDQGY